MSDTLPPHDPDMEAAVLGGILIDPAALYEVPWLTAGDFYGGNNRAVYQAILGLRERNMAIDPATVMAALDGHDLDGYVVGLMNAVPTSINTRDYARVVASYAQRRRLIAAAGAVASAAYDTGRNIDAVMADATAAMLEATDSGGLGGDLVAARRGMSDLLDATMERHAAGGVSGGQLTGIADIDSILDGLLPGNLYVLAGRPGMGKSALEGTIARNISARGAVVARFNLEMPAIQIWQRLACAETGLSFRALQRGDLSEGDMARFTRAVGELSERQMYVDDTPALSVTTMLSRCRRLQMQRGLDLVTVDYLQLMQAERNLGNRVQEVGEVSRGLKQAAKALNVPVLALAQLSRGVEQRHDKRPILSDLRDSGEIEQDADAVLFLYRDEMYYPDTTEVPNQAEVIVAKHRNGATGTARLFWHASRMTFANLARQEVRL